jgi:hypothetical protein
MDRLDNRLGGGQEKQWSNMLATQSQGNVVAPTMALRRDQHHAGGL